MMAIAVLRRAFRDCHQIPQLYSRPRVVTFIHVVGARCKASPVPLSETWPRANETNKVLSRLEGTAPETVAAITDPAFDRLDLNFNNAQEAFKSKSNSELLRALLVFNFCSIPFVVNNNKKLLQLSRRLMGRSLFTTMMKQTFYGQFVGGEDLKDIRPVVERNLNFGVKSILDYSVEKDMSKDEAKQKEIESCAPDEKPVVPDEKAGIYKRYRVHEEFGDRREQVFAARTYFYEDEDNCDKNMDVFLDCIDGIAGAKNVTGFAAIKVTALGRPQLLMQLSEVLSRVRRHFEQLSTFTGNEKGKITQVDFERYLKRINLDREERRKWYTLLDSSQDGEIDLLDWFNLLEVNISLAKLLRVPNIQTGELEPLVQCLTEDEEIQMKNMLHRIDSIVKRGVERDVRVMIDAEQTYFQPAINRLTMEMMRKYNREKAIVFNTYQCYLKESFAQISTDLALAHREDFYFGAKLVRGAYMEQERKRAQTVGYEDPICPGFDATTQMYERVFNEVLRHVQTRQRGKVTAMIASHNEKTVTDIVTKMKEHGVRSDDRIFCFGQLLGMCDQVSFSLGQAGYSVYKYVPYGPVEEVVPYLSRRAMENRGVLAKVKKERQLLSSELKRRVLSGQIFYKPPEGPMEGKMGLPLAMMTDDKH